MLGVSITRQSHFGSKVEPFKPFKQVETISKTLKIVKKLAELF